MSGAVRQRAGARSARPHCAPGFTLIELLVALAIIGILAGAIFPLAELGVQRHKEQQLRDALQTLRGALDAYRRAVDAGHIERAPQASGYPRTLADLVHGRSDLKHPQGAPLRFLRRIPRDPFYPEATVPAEQTWGLRSYASSAVAPRPGDDVYDVYSLAPGTGLNGLAYREW